MTITIKFAQWLAVAGLLTILVFVLASSFPIGSQFGTHAGLLVLGAGLSLACIMLPVFAKRELDLFEPLSFSILAVLVGVTLKPTYLYWFADADSLAYLLQGRTPQFLMRSMFIVCLGLLTFSIGYILVQGRWAIERYNFIARTDWGDRSCLMVAVLCALVAATAFLLFAREMGVINLVAGQVSDYSSKRFIRVDGAVGKIYLGYHQLFIDFAQAAFVMLMTHAVVSRNRRRKLSLTVLFMIFILGIMALAFPIFKSSRTSAVMVILCPFIAYYYGSQKIRLSRLVIVVAASVVLILGLSQLRNDLSKKRMEEDKSALHSLMEVFVGSRHFLDITKTAHTIEAVPGELEYKFGETLLTWLYLPVPRTMWPEKPVIGNGPEVANKVYGMDYRFAGIPPGFVAESYMNFGIFGVVTLMGFAGVFMKLFYNSFAPLLRARNPNAIVIYSGCIFSVSFGWLTTGLSKMAAGLIGDLVPLFVVLIGVQWLSSRSRGSHGKKGNWELPAV